MRWLFIIFLWPPLLTVNLSAQQLQWENFNLPPLLKEAQPRVIYQSHEGLIWLATSAGVSTFDGTSFTSFFRPDSLSTDAVVLFEAQDNVIWVGYADGSVDRLIQGQLEPWNPEEGHPAAAITGFAQDGEGRMWISTYGEGTYVVDGRHLYNFNTDDGLLGNDVYTISRQADGSIWLGTDGGISICEFQQGKKTVRNLTRDDGLPDEIVRALLPDKEGNCWIGTHDKGIVYYDQSTKTFRSPLNAWSYGSINDLALVEGRELIVATETEGAWRLNLANGLLSPLSSTSRNLGEKMKILDLFQDDEGGLWLLPDRGGLFRANQKIAFVEAPGREVQAVRLDHNGTLWAGTDRGLFTLSPSGTLLPYPPTAGLNIVSLFEDYYGNLWLGTFGDGVYILDPETETLRHQGPAEGLLNGSILSIDGKESRIWLASLGGVTKVDLQRNPMAGGPLSFQKITGLKTDFIYQVLAENAHRVWFATDGEGLALLENDKVTHFKEIQTVTGDSLTLRRVYSLTNSGDGRIWLNTAREGLFELSNDSLYNRSSGKAVSGDNTTGMAETGHDQLVVSHTQGVSLLNISSGHFQNIFEQEERESDFRPILNAVATGRKQQVWFGCSGGLIRYQDRPNPTRDRPHIVLRSVSVYPGNRPEPEGKRFSYSENTLAFNFFGLWYTAPEKVRCRYQLEGYDPGWVETRNQRVIYSKLAPGDYTFHVAVSAGDHWDETNVETYHFSIIPPLWQRWWFIIFILAVSTILIRSLVRRREGQLRRESLLQKQRVESQYEALKSQINPHFLFNSFNTLIAMIEETPADAVIYTEKLSDLFRNVLQYRNQETIPLKEELELLRNYLFLLDKRFGDKLKVKIEVEARSEFLVPLSLQLLLENAIKHNVVSAQRPLNVRISLREDRKYVCVSNTLQPKLRPEPSTGFGLRSLSERYALLSTEGIHIEKTDKKFLVCIPVLLPPLTK